MDDFNHRQTERRKGISWPVALIGAAVLVALTSFGSFYWWNHMGFYSIVKGLPTRTEEAQTLREMVASPLFERLLRVITIERQEYLERVSLEQVLEGAIEGAVGALEDPYSVYFDTGEFTDFSTETGGRYAGIGVQVSERDGQIVVVSPFPNTPGAETPFEGAKPGDPKGLRPNDIILKVDDRDVSNLRVEDVAELIRGPVGTIVTLTVLRETEAGQEQRIFRVERVEITIPTTTTQVWNPSMTGGKGPVGYLQITMFNENTAEQVEESLRELKAAGIKGLVLDLRFNPGGLLDQVVRVAGQFVPEGPVVFVEDRNGNRVSYDSENQTGGIGMPLVVLVNEATASASEILAGAIQDTQVGTIVGQTTFGKGVVQRVWELGEGTGLKITTARYLTPAGRDINRRTDPDTGEETGGIIPDVVVESQEQTVFGNPSQDIQLQKALDILQDNLQ